MKISTAHMAFNAMHIFIYFSFINFVSKLYMYFHITIGNSKVCRRIKLYIVSMQLLCRTVTNKIGCEPPYVKWQNTLSRTMQNYLFVEVNTKTGFLRLTKKYYNGSNSFLYSQFSVMRRDFARLLIFTLDNNATAVKIK